MVLPDPAGELEAALAATAAALDGGDATGAAEASQRAARACAELEARGQPLSLEAVERARILQTRCAEAAGATMARLAVQLEVAARSRRATDAYRR